MQKVERATDSLSDAEAIEELRAAAAILGIPTRGNSLCLLTIDGLEPEGEQAVRMHFIRAGQLYTHATAGLDLGPRGQRWAGYRLEAVGYVTHHAAHDPAAPAFPFGSFVDDEREQVAQFWQVRVFSPKTPLYAELRWRPGYARAEPYIGGALNKIPARAWVERAWKAFGLIRVLDQSAHPGRKTLLEEDDPGWRKQADDLVKLRALGYTWPECHGRTGVPESTARRWVKNRKLERENGH